MTQNIFKIRDAKTRETVREVVLSPEESMAWAEQFELAALSNVKATFVIEQIEDGTLFHVKMAVKASAEIAMPLSDNTMKIDIDEEEDDLFTTRADLTAGDDEEEVDIYAPELITDSQIDLEEMMKDYLYLMIEEEFTRLTGNSINASFEETDLQIEETRRPFSNLRELLDKKK